MRAHSNKGVTLPELMVMLAIVVILTVAAVPSLVSTVQKHRISATTENLYYVLQYARSEAVKRNSNVYVSFVTGDSWCYGVNAGSSCTCSTAGSCGLGSTSAPQAQQTSLSQTNYGTGSFYFEGSHGAANAAGSLTYTLYGQSNLITISISRLGNLQMCSTGISGYTAC